MLNQKASSTAEIRAGINTDPDAWDTDTKPIDGTIVNGHFNSKSFPNHEL